MARKTKKKLTPEQKQAVTDYLINRQLEKIEEADKKFASYEKRDQNKIDKAPLVAKIKAKEEINQLKKAEKRVRSKKGIRYSKKTHTT